MSLAVNVLGGISSSFILFLTPTSLIHADELPSLSSGGYASHLRWCLVHRPRQLCPSAVSSTTAWELEADFSSSSDTVHFSAVPSSVLVSSL